MLVESEDLFVSFYEVFASHRSMAEIQYTSAFMQKFNIDWHCGSSGDYFEV